MDKDFDLSGALNPTIDSAEMQQLLIGMRDRIKNGRTQYFRQVANIARASFRNNFAVGGDPAWKPLRPSTIAAKSRLAQFPAVLGRRSGRVPRRLMQNGSFSPSSILIYTGRLRDSVGQVSHPDNITQITNDGIVLGTKVPYAGVQNDGGQKTYQITASAGKRLMFFGADGSPVFRKFVTHSPLPARPFLTVDEESMEKIAQLGSDWIVGNASG